MQFSVNKTRCFSAVAELLVYSVQCCYAVHWTDNEIEQLAAWVMSRPSIARWSNKK